MEHFPALAKTLVDLSDENTRISLGFERRLASRDEEFFALLKEHFTWEEVRLPCPRPLRITFLTVTNLH
jgi:hypothetical protein